MEKLFAFCFSEIPPVVRTLLIGKWESCCPEDLTLKSAKSHFSALCRCPKQRSRIVRFFEEESLKPSDFPILSQYPQLLLDLLESQFSREHNKDKLIFFTSDGNGLKLDIFESHVFQMTNFLDEEELTTCLVRAMEMAFNNGFQKGSVHILHKDIGLVYEQFRRVMAHFKLLGWLFEHKRLYPRTDYKSKGVYVNVKYLMPDSTLLWIETK